MNIGSLLTRHARYRPDHVAVVFEDQRLTFAQLNRRVNRLANALLSLGVKKGDKVATILPNSLELLDVYWAVAKMGAVVAPLSPLLRGPALAALLRDSESTTLITDRHFVETIDALKPDLPAIAADRYLLVGEEEVSGYRAYRELVGAASDENPRGIEIDRDDPYNIIYSSGTTGTPKGIIHTHYIRGMYCTTFATMLRMNPESIVVHAGSMVFNGAFAMLLPSMFLGATIVLLKQFDPDKYIETIERERATHVMVVPSQLIAALNSPKFSFDALQSLETIISVGAPLHREHKERLTRALPDRFYELYGLTEGFLTFLDKYDYPTKPNSVGVPTAFFEMRIVNEQGMEVPAGEVGEIVGRSPILMPGYYNKPEQTAQAVVDGWLHSGDLGYVDEDGFLYLVDRMKDLIVSGGANVYPKDIEEVIVQHPAVREAAVFGVPHEKWGETPLAAVVLHRPGEVTEESLKAWVNERVDAKFQRIHAVVIMEDFPRNTAGKTLKRVMREPYWAGRETKI